MSERKVWLLPTGTFIRDFLLAYKEAYAYEVWKALKKERRERELIAPTYRSFWNTWSILRKLELIRLVRVEQPLPKAKWYRRYFTIVPGMEDHPAWYHPQVALYPLTQLGQKDYTKLKELAEKEKLRVGTYYIRHYPERIEALARDLKISRGEVERRIRGR